MTPEDIRDRKFNARIWGYGTREVDTFLATVADSFEELTRESKALSEQVKGLSDDLDLYKGREESVIKTMMASQKVCEDMKRNAEKESRIILAEAELKADRIIKEAEEKTSAIREEIMELKRQKMQFEESLRSSLATHMKLIDISRESE